jgi:hypothetical protein
MVLSVWRIFIILPSLSTGPLLNAFPYDSFHSLVNVFDPRFQLEQTARVAFPDVQVAGRKSNLLVAALASSSAYESLAKIRTVVTADWQVVCA